MQEKANDVHQSDLSYLGTLVGSRLLDTRKININESFMPAMRGEYQSLVRLLLVLLIKVFLTKQTFSRDYTQ